MKLALALLLTGCSTLSWTCPVPATVTLEDTRPRPDGRDAGLCEGAACGEVARASRDAGGSAMIERHLDHPTRRRRSDARPVAHVRLLRRRRARRLEDPRLADVRPVP